MKIYPAIDIKDGKAVRLYQGDYNAVTVYGDPVVTACEFSAAGAKQLHLVDLDGALDGVQTNRATIEKIAASSGAFVEIGGGIRDRKAIDSYLSAGVGRVILGSIAVEKFDFVVEAVKEYGDKIAVGVDAKNGQVAIHGWKTLTDLKTIDFCNRLYDVGVGAVICTDISRDGTLEGPNFSVYEDLVKINGLNVIASGGVSILDDLVRLDGIGVSGAILGKALYEKRVTLSEALALDI